MLSQASMKLCLLRYQLFKCFLFQMLPLACIAPKSNGRPKLLILQDRGSQEAQRSSPSPTHPPASFPCLF